jgi:hypothetical protein
MLQAMALRRRDFIKAGAGLALAGLRPERIFGLQSSPPSARVSADEFPYPYDDKVFECAERVFNIRRNPADPSSWQAGISLVVKEGKKLDIKVLVADRSEDLAYPRAVESLSGAQGILNVSVTGYDSPRLYYQVQYREGQNAWRSQAPRNFKLPNLSLQSGGQFKVIFIADDHNFDDAEYGVTAEYQQTKISGDYVNDFLRNLRTNTNWYPDYPLSNLMFGYALAKAIRHILTYEDPDLVIHLGDATGIGASYRWKSWGLPYQNLKEADFEYIAKTLWLRMRKIFSGLTPNIPMYIALGNHDGDEGWNSARFRAKYWRQKLFALPDASTYPEGGHEDGNYYAFSWGADRNNSGGILFLVLDVTGFMGGEPQSPQEWTLGPAQLNWFEETLKKIDHEWSFACYHHVLGGWPAGPTELETNSAYGRGPLFTDKDYLPYGEPSKVEQVKLTETAKTFGLRGFIYGHDHIFHSIKIGEGTNHKDLYGLVCGSTRYIGEKSWWEGTFWKKYYGAAEKTPPDFWGPSGITRLTVKKDQARFDYVCTCHTPYTNLPSGGTEGAISASLVLATAAPSIVVDKTSIVFETQEGATYTPSSSPTVQNSLRIRNGGGRVLNYTLEPAQEWVKVSPDTGSSWGEWTEVTVSLAIEHPKAGTYDGTITIKSSDASNSPVHVQVRVQISEAPLYPPLKFAARRISGLFSSPLADVIILTWQRNPLNADVQHYRLYLFDEEGKRLILGEVGPATFSYIYEGAKKNKSYRFGIAAIDSRKREGEAAFTTA